MKTRNKKGFTIVELVIVIAVIGILTAILVPVFINLTNKANEASDNSLVKNLNTALRMEEQTAGHKKAPTLQGAIDDLENQGYLLENLQSKSGLDLLWDQEDNQFLLNKDGVAGAKYWKIVDTLPELDQQVYSYYAGQNFNSNTIANVKYGFDVGDNEGIEKITFENKGAAREDTIAIRTNGGTLTVDAKDDNVLHYGYADSVNVIDVATASYHENGTVKFLEVAAGHIVLEENSEVSAVHFTATGEGDEAKFENTEGKKISIDLSKVNTDDISFSRDAVTIAENGTYVAEVTTDGTEYIWLFGNGIKEQMVVTDTTDPIAENGTLKAGIEAGAEDGSVAEQIANPAKRNAEGQLVAADGETVVTAENAVVEEVASKESVQIGATLFAGGTGTESNPFLIVDYDTMQKVSEVYHNTFSVGVNYYYNLKDNNGNWVCDTKEDAEAMAIANGYNRNNNGPFYFKVKDGISAIDCNQDGRSWIPVELLGYFDGNGVVFNNVNKGLFKSTNGDEVVIKNFTLNANISVSSGVGAVVYNSNTLNLTIDSVDVHGTIIGASWVTPYVEFGPGPDYAWNLTIKNSVSDATLVATSGNASGFVGHPYDDVSNGSVNGSSLITIIDSAYIGNMTATGSVTGTNFKYFTINGNVNRIKTYYSEEFIEELGYNPEGTLYATPTTGYDNKGKTNEVEYLVINNEDGSKTFFCGNSGKNVVDNYKPTEKKVVLNTTSQATLPSNIGDVFTVTKVSGAVKAVVSLQIAPNDQNNYGSYLGTYMSEEIDISSVASGSTFTSEEVRYFTININSGATSKTGVSGNIFNVVNSYYGKNAHNGASVKIVQFDANGNVLNITSVQIAAPHSAE